MIIIEFYYYQFQFPQNIIQPTLASKSHQTIFSLTIRSDISCLNPMGKKNEQSKVERAFD